VKNRSIRIFIGAFCALALVVIFVFQKIDLAEEIGITSKVANFTFNRIIRFFLNDIFAIGLIYAIFNDVKYVIFAFWVQLFGVVFILIPYLILKAYFNSYNGPFLSFLHRLIINPTLILLLIPAFYYQQKTRS
jgi:exosortase F-associated protein